MHEHWNDRTVLLLQDENYKKLEKAHVLIVGLGGVGGYVAEQLCRAGVGKLTLVDGDKVHLSNINRQLIAFEDNCGQSKTQVLAERLRRIHPNVELVLFPEYIKDKRTEEVLMAAPYDYVVDAIDTLSPKIFLLYHAKRLGLKVVSSMGSGGKLDPSRVTVADISQTYMCPLADVLRKRLHKLGIYEGIQAVFSPQKVLRNAVREVDNEPNKKTTLGTISYMPAIFGCFCASVVVRELIGEEITSDLPIPAAVRKKIKEQARTSCLGVKNSKTDS